MSAGHQEGDLRLSAEGGRAEQVMREHVVNGVVSVFEPETGFAVDRVITLGVHVGVAVRAVERRGVVKDRDMQVPPEHNRPERGGGVGASGGRSGEESAFLRGEEGVVSSAAADGSEREGGRVGVGSPAAEFPISVCCGLLKVPEISCRAQAQVAAVRRQVRRDQSQIGGTGGRGRLAPCAVEGSVERREGTRRGTRPARQNRRMSLGMRRRRLI